MDKVDPSDFQPSTQNINGSAGGVIILTPESDTKQVYMVIPPSLAIPIVFLPGVMGSNLRMTKSRQEKLKRKDNRAWRPDDAGDTLVRRHDDPDIRQLNFDPDETEVEYYEWTADGKRFDATQADDKRHSNVPDSLESIHPLLISDPVPIGLHAQPTQDAATAAQKARRRGWSEVMFDSYGSALKEFEARLNNAVQFMTGDKIEGVWEFNYLNKPPSAWAKPEGTTIKEALTQEEITALGKSWLPVHAMGYNWLKSNGESAKYVAQRIKDLKARYEKFGFTCPGVIVVTHSMGGLLGRALVHPKYGNLKTEVLGMVHGVMPTHGAAATYKRMRAGFEGGAFWDVSANMTQKVLGDDGEKVTAVLANAPGVLELLPNDLYGADWLVVQDSSGKTLQSWPKQGSAVHEVYIQPNSAWWRLMNPDWTDPAEKYKEEGGSSKFVAWNLQSASKFSNAIADTFHTSTYAHYGNDPYKKSFNRVIWRVVEGDAIDAGPPASWTLLADNKRGQIQVRTASQRTLTLELQAPADAGDETVPSDRSASKVRAKHWVQTGYDHQNSYKDHQVQAATIYSVAKMASQVVRQAYERKTQ
jgi:hypothetical protein